MDELVIRKVWTNKEASWVMAVFAAGLAIALAMQAAAPDPPPGDDRVRKVGNQQPRNASQNGLEDRTGDSAVQEGNKGTGSATSKVGKGASGVATITNHGVHCPGPASCIKDGAVPGADPDGSGNGSTSFRVILPPGYPPHSGTPYPVLYLLHGVGDTYLSWTANTDVEELVADLANEDKKPVVVVMPDGGHDADAGWYTDWNDLSRAWEAFHIKRLLPHMERIYRVDKNKRMIAGLSMGGYGAIKYAADADGDGPEFPAAASFSGFLDTMWGYPANAAAFEGLNSRFGTPTQKVWGDPSKVGNWRANNPSDPDFIQKLKNRDAALLIATGQGAPITGKYDDTRSIPGKPDSLSPFLGLHGLEHYIWQTNVSFVSRLTAFGIPHERNFYNGGSHRWEYWQDDLHWALPCMINVVNGEEATCSVS